MKRAIQVLRTVQRSIISTPQGIVYGIAAVHFGSWAFISLVLLIFTAEDSLHDAVSAGAVGASMFTAGAAMTTALACVAMVSEQPHMELSHAQFANNATRLLAPARPAATFVAISFAISDANWIVKIVAIAGAAYENWVWTSHQTSRVFEPATLFKHEKHISRSAVSIAAYMGVVILYGGAHVTYLVLRASMGLLLRAASAFSSQSEPGSFWNWWK